MKQKEGRKGGNENGGKKAEEGGKVEAKGKEDKKEIRKKELRKEEGRKDEAKGREERRK